MFSIPYQTVEKIIAAFRRQGSDLSTFKDLRKHKEKFTQFKDIKDDLLSYSLLQEWAGKPLIERTHLIKKRYGIKISLSHLY